jgi:hypothetical protein
MLIPSMAKSLPAVDNILMIGGYASADREHLFPRPIFERSVASGHAFGDENSSEGQVRIGKPREIPECHLDVNQAVLTRLGRGSFTKNERFLPGALRGRTSLGLAAFARPRPAGQRNDRD